MSTSNNIGGEPILVANPQNGDVLSYANGTWINGQPAGGGGGGAPQMFGSSRRSEVDDLLLGVEVKLGGFSLRPDVFSGATFYLGMVGTLTDGGGVAPSFELRLYDMGAPGVPQAGDLRTTATLNTAGSPQRVNSLSLTVVPGPGLVANQILDAERIYEVRGVLTGDVGDLVEIDWAGVIGWGA